MRILIHSPSFFPAVGGVETVARLLATSFVAAGHSVRVLTETPCGDTPDETFQVIRTTSLLETYRQVKWCQGYLQMGLALKGVYPLPLLHRRWVISHQTWYTPSRSPLNRMKRGLMRHATNAFCSAAVARELGVSGKVIGNPYDDTTFRRHAHAVRPPRSLVFAGRLVSDKGVDVLLHALSLLKDGGIDASLDIIGDGPELPSLGSLTRELGLDDRVRYLGAMRRGELAAALNQHEVMVVPSRWDEPFGVVALEGIACGCIVIASRGGGLPEAVGPCGASFSNGDARSLATALRDLFEDPLRIARLLEQATMHLEGFRPAIVASRYLSLLQAASQHCSYTSIRHANP